MKETTPHIALVTGASRGIGAAIALELAHQGFVVIGTATTDDGAAKISNALSAHAKCRGVNLNVNDATAVDALVEQITTEHKALHVLVNNAGITRDTLAMRMKDDDWDAVLWMMRILAWWGINQSISDSCTPALFKTAWAASSSKPTANLTCRLFVQVLFTH